LREEESLAREHLLRRLVAVFAADAAGYSRLTGADEEGTHVRLREHLQGLFVPNIAAHRGTIVKNTGDGLLAEFDSVVDAVRCALDVQRGMADRNGAVPSNQRIEFRIGINVGDIIKDAGDIFGDVVNVAVRLEAIAEPGGICLSDDAHRHVRDKLDIACDDGGEQRLKNIERPVRVFRVRDHGIAVSQRPALELPDRPSIAILPFQNLSTDPEQEYFADGIVEDITMALSRFRWLFVIARNSSFTYKGRAVDVKQVGRELGVRYVMEGSVRKADARVRISSQLVDADTGAHLWANHFDGTLEDMFDLQDQVTLSVVGAIAPKLQRAEIKRALRKPIDNLDAYDRYLRGLACIHRWTRDGNNEGLEHFRTAIELEPGLAAAYGLAAWCYVRRKAHGWMVDATLESGEATRLARTAVLIGRDDPMAMCLGGYALAFIDQEFDDAAAFMDQGLAVNPNYASAWMLSAWLRVWRGEPDLAIDHAARARRLSPLDPTMFGIHAAAACAHLLARRYDEASSLADQATRDLPSFLLGICISAASKALAGRLDEARRVISRAFESDPDLRLSSLKRLAPFRRPEDFAMFANGLSKAGLPD
jgi:TolB-like protein/tetratricopeptide (TPR) repeat protein